ncbi:MAG: hypothetical protein OXH32_12255 [Acidobacteria bacterium]|nr:hypothetical protein [Acidobacteriota bacterium]MXZ38826.1 hypothetical protein [Holophagales bacterium]MYF05557.1 hypothetical protein [Holophagales bacterium]MYJ26084.1 hypothetical protein [Holophagales bacterium]
MRGSLLLAVLAALSGIVEAQAQEPEGSCTGDGTSLCLNDDRFRVTVRWEDAAGDSGDGQAVQLTGDTGYFWFFGEDNVEVVIKVLNGCGIGDGAYWVFIGGLTDVRVEVDIEDVEAEETRTYVNELGTLFVPVSDTAAFLTCD